MSADRKVIQIKDRRVNRGPGVNFEKRVVQAGRRIIENNARLLEMRGSVVALSPQEQILEREEDLQMLMTNERQYSDSLRQKTGVERVFGVLKSWGMSQDEVVSFRQGEDETMADLMGRLMPAAERLFLKDRQRIVVYKSIVDPLMKIKVFYSDEIDDFVTKNPDLFADIPRGEITAEQIRTQQETLALIRMQIDHLKSKKKEEKKERKKQDKLQSKKGKSPLTVSINEPVALESDEGTVESQAPQAATEAKAQEPFGLSNWKVYWTDARFSTSPNQLVEMPTSTRDEFFSAMDELNAGRKHFQIKASSVAACLEMWDIKEFRDKAQGAKFRFGPQILRDWAKIVRGGVRIMINADEEAKRIVFFASDRDAVYARGIASW